MNLLTYNIAMMSGTLLASVGAGLTWGLGIGLLTAGCLVISLTFLGAWLTGKA